ncbi:MAG: transglycosylase domain-containing protein [Dermatophilaceae bacterium]
MQGRAQSLPQVLRLLGAFVVTAVAMGLLMAGLAMPAVGASGAAANSSIAAFEDLPSDFTASPLAQQSVILDAKGGVIATPYDENRIIVPLASIAPIMQQAVIAIEDSRFYEHNGLDLRGLSRAVVSNLQNDDVQGASTITQQYVKIALQESALKRGDTEAAQAATRVSLDRKVQELKYAMSLEKELTKEEILENYLNLVYFGDLAYGVEAAAQNYFSISATDLNLGQSALLAGTIQNPGTTDPVGNPEAAERRRNTVLDRMEELRLASPEDVAAWKAVPVAEMLQVKPAQNTCQRASMPFVCQYVINWLLQQPELGETFEERKKQVYTGGLTIRTTFDPDIYQSSMRHLTEQVPIGDPTEVGASAVVVEPGTGKILSLAQTSTYGNNEGTFGVTEVNWSVDQKWGESGGFQIGSAAKIYSMVRALEEGIGVDTTVVARRYDSPEGATFEPDESVDDCGPNEPITVRNSEADAGGRMPFREAMAKSVNTAFIPLVLSKVGVCDTQEMMTRMGLHRSSGEPMNPFLSEVTLGSGESSPMTVALSFATLAANGLHCEPYPVTEVTSTDGEVLMAPESACEQVVEPDIVAGANEMLSGVMERGGTGFRGALADGRVSAGKTGTTDRFVQSWFVGYTPQLATAVYVGRPDSNTQPMRNIRIGGNFYERVYGSTIALPIWKRIMDDASSGMDRATFPPPGQEVLRGQTVDIPEVAGRTLSEARRILAQAGFDGYVIEVSARSSRGTVLGTQPRGSAPKGSSVGILVSSGYTPPPPPQRSAPRPAPAPAPEEPAPDPGDSDNPGDGRGGGPPGGGDD